MPETKTLDTNTYSSLLEVVGEDYLITDVTELAYYSHDIYRSIEQALAIVRPGNIDELCQVIKIAADDGLTIVTRGGGMSYTDGYLHATDRGITIDTQRLNNIIEINAEDMYVTVECGCTWQVLNEVLAKYHIRPPFWGPLSGMRATIGGALSQNSVFWGGASYGSASESVIGMDIVLIDGTLLSTGAHARNNGLPFMRYDGPDLTGLFVGDTGAFGIKATATLRLVAIPEFVRYASFSFDTHEQVCAAMSGIARQGLASECYAFDPYYSNSRVLGSETDIVEDVRTLARIARKSGIRESVKVAITGRRFIKKVQWGLHVNVENSCEQGIDKALESIYQIVEQYEGREIPNSLPKIVGACPFPPTNSMLGPKGERWVPIHGVVAHSQAAETIEKINAWHTENAELMNKLNIDTGYLFCTIGASGFLIEPVYLWPDELEEIHIRNVDASVLDSFDSNPLNIKTREEVGRLRNGVRDIFLEQGAVHFQIGKYYPYKQSRKEKSWQILEQIKSLLDKNNLINPGQLGFHYEK